MCSFFYVVLARNGGMDNFQSAAAAGGEAATATAAIIGRTGRAIHSAASSPPSLPLALEHTAHDDIHFAKMHLVH